MVVDPRGVDGPLRTLVGQIGLGVGAAAVVQGDDAAVVGGPLVGAHTEDGAQGASHRHEEAAGRAGGVGLADTLGLGAVVAAVPALGGTGDALSAQDPGAAQVELIQGDGVGVLAGGLPPGLEALVGLLAGEAVGAGDVAGFEALGPWDPGGREEGLLAGEELHLADGGGAAARDATEGDRPAPAAVAAQGAVEQVGDEALGVGRGGHVLADGDGVGDLLQRVAGQLDGRRGGEGLVLGGQGLLAGGRQGAGARHGGRRRRGRGRARCRGRALQGRSGGARPGGGARWRTRVGPGCGLA